MLKTAPAVFAVEHDYQIMVEVTKPCLFWVRVNGEEFYDESNGILRSQSDLHRVTVPMELLDRAGGYTVCLRPLIERKPYFTETAPVVEYAYPFFPVPGDNVRAYHIADAHNRIDGPVAAARTFGDIDLLILNGDVIDHSGDPSKFHNIYEIASQITGGSKPVIFSRGNHDMRGNYAESFAQYTPNAHGNTYYTFRLGSIWGLLLDCGEDKPDDHPEYGWTVCCHAFRKRQSAFLRRLIANSAEEYAAEGVTTRLVIAHNPFTRVDKSPFDIEREEYSLWASLLRQEIQPDVMICGHVHTLRILMPGDEWDHLGQACPVVIGAKPEDDKYTGCGYIFRSGETQVVFTDSTGGKSETVTLPHTR